MTMTVAQEWTDGITMVRREGTTVTVQILGDVYRTRYDDDDEAMIAYAAEIAGVMDTNERIAAWRATLPADDGEYSIEDDHEWIRRGC
jgi:hypothetical protein